MRPKIVVVGEYHSLLSLFPVDLNRCLNYFKTHLRNFSLHTRDPSSCSVLSSLLLGVVPLLEAFV